MKLLSHVWLFGTPLDCSLPGSSIHGIFQARVLEWVVISFSRGSSRPRGRTWVSHIAGRCFTVWATREAPLHGVRVFAGKLLDSFFFFSCTVALQCFSFCRTAEWISYACTYIHSLLDFHPIYPVPWFFCSSYPLPIWTVSSKLLNMHVQECCPLMKQVWWRKDYTLPIGVPSLYFRQFFAYMFLSNILG